MHIYFYYIHIKVYLQSKGSTGFTQKTKPFLHSSCCGPEPHSNLVLNITWSKNMETWSFGLHNFIWWGKWLLTSSYRAITIITAVIIRLMVCSSFDLVLQNFSFYLLGLWKLEIPPNEMFSIASTRNWTSLKLSRRAFLLRKFIPFTIDTPRQNTTPTTPKDWQKGGFLCETP